MAKKLHSQQAPASDFASIEKSALEEMVNGRFRRARDAYKVLCKSDRTKYLPHLIEANRRLVEQLTEKGQFSEAEQVMAYLKTIAPPAALTAMALGVAMKAQKWAEASLAAARLWTDAHGALEERDAFLIADALVLGFPDLEGAWIPAGLKLELSAILGALQYISEERYEQAQEALRPLPRNSIFADWKMLLKGWLAFYEGDLIKANTLFARLRSDGVPMRAAAPYRAFSAPDTKLDEPMVTALCHLLSLPALGPVLVRAQQDWVKSLYAESYQGVRSFAGFPSEQADFLGVLSDFYFGVLQQSKAAAFQKYNESFLRITNTEKYKNEVEARRLIGMMGCLALKNPNDPNYAKVIWRDYLDHCPKEEPLYGKRASLVLERVGSLFAQVIHQSSISSQKERFLDANSAKKLLRESIQHDPSHLAPYLKLLEVLDFEQDTSERNQLLDEMTLRFPAEKAVLLRAGRSCIERKAYAKGVDYLEQAHELDALDPAISGALLTALMRQGRHYFEKKTPSKGRETFAKAAPYAVPDQTDIHRGLDFLQARRAVLETLFGDPALGKPLVDAMRETAQTQPALLLFAHVYHRLCEQGHPQKTPYWKELKSGKVRTAQERRTLFPVLQYARLLDNNIVWNAETDFVRDCIAPVAAKAFTADEAAHYILLLAQDSPFRPLVKKLIARGLRHDPKNPQFRLFEVLNRQGSPSDEWIVEVERIQEDARRCGDKNTEKEAASLIRNMERLLDEEDGFDVENDSDDFDAEDDNFGEDDDFSFSNIIIKTMQKHAAQMNDAEFKAFRKESGSVIPLEFFDKVMAGVRGKPSKPTKSTPDNPNQLDLF